MRIGRAILNAVKRIVSSPMTRAALSVAATTIPAAGCHENTVDKYEYLQFQIDRVEVVEWDKEEGTVRLAPVTPDQIRPFPENICSSSPTIPMLSYEGTARHPAGEREASTDEVARIFNGETNPFRLMNTIYIFSSSQATIPGMIFPKAMEAMGRGEDLCGTGTVVMNTPDFDFEALRPQIALDNFRECE